MAVQQKYYKECSVGITDVSLRNVQPYPKLLYKNEDARDLPFLTDLVYFNRANVFFLTALFTRVFWRSKIATRNG